MNKIVKFNYEKKEYLDMKFVVLIAFIFLFLFLTHSTTAQIINSTSLCLNNMTQQTTTGVIVNSSTSNDTITISQPSVFCPTGCSSLTNSCRPDFSMQIFEIAGITGGFFALLFLGIFISNYIPFLDTSMSLILAILAAIIGLTDIFSSNLGYIFYAESIIFTISTSILIWRNLYG